MRIRSVKPEFWTDRVTGRWDTEMKLVYIALWNLADDEGRFEYEPDLIRSQLFPYGCPFCLETVMARIAETKKLRLYSVGGIAYGVIPSFQEHQHPTRRINSRLPPPPEIHEWNPPAVLPQPPCIADAVQMQCISSPVEEGRGEEKEGNTNVVEANASDDAGAFERVAEVWDRVCVPAGFAKTRSTPQQRKAARTRMREAGWFESFEAACSYMAREPFYRGGGSSGWVATLGWLLKPGNTEKTAERGTTTKAAGPKSNRSQTPIGDDWSKGLEDVG
jgi:hypothetical protein